MPPKKKAKKANVKKATMADIPVAGEPLTREISRRKDCPDCGSVNIIFEPETEQLICQDCGSIFEELPPDLERKYTEVDYI